MTLPQALIAFTAAAGLLTLTPGLDTALVIRTASVEGSRRALLASFGIGAGCLLWGVAVSLGLGLLLAASELAYTVLKWAGALYLFYLGAKLLVAPRSRFAVEAAPSGRSGGQAFLRGLLTNLLNPKVGIFYVSFLPQFVPAGMPVAPFVLALACLHLSMGVAWLSVLIAALRPIKRLLQAPGVVRWLDRVTGAVFLGFGLKLALSERR